MTPDPIVSVALGAAGMAGLDAVREFAKRIGGKLGDDVGDFLRQYTTHRLKNIADRMAEAHAMVEAAGREPSAVPPRTLIRWMDHASVEDDESLSKWWAAILANAAIASDDEAAPPIYAAILSELTPFAAKLLDSLQHTEPLGPSKHDSTTAEGLAWRVFPQDYDPDASPAQRFEHLQRVEAAIDVLDRQGLATRSLRFELRWPTVGQLFPGAHPSIHVDKTEIRITELGRRFLAACTPPASLGSARPQPEGDS